MHLRPRSSEWCDVTASHLFVEVLRRRRPRRRRGSVNNEIAEEMVACRSGLLATSRGQSVVDRLSLYDAEEVFVCLRVTDDVEGAEVGRGRAGRWRKGGGGSHTDHVSDKGGGYALLFFLPCKIYEDEEKRSQVVERGGTVGLCRESRKHRTKLNDAKPSDTKPSQADKRSQAKQSRK